jgi:hypothetical protein
MMGHSAVDGIKLPTETWEQVFIVSKHIDSLQVA